MRKLFKLFFSFLVTFAFVLSSFTLVAATNIVSANEHHEDVTCKEYTSKVTLSVSDPTIYNLVGKLCYEGSLANKALQLTIHGATYNSNYWDFDYQPGRYSYVQYAVDQGYATYNIDRIGNGKSSIPDGNLVTITASAYTVHQVIAGLRDGSLTHHKFKTVVLVGHSLGSMISETDASTYPGDADALILTGFANYLNPNLVNVTYPAQSDPKFGSTFPNNYLTSMPGTRGSIFYYAPNSDPKVIAVDEAEKDVVSMGIFADISNLFGTQSLNIKVPVYILDGQFDNYFCGDTTLPCTQTALTAYESNFFSPEAKLKISVIPNTGHDLNLHYSARSTYEKMNDWLDNTLKHGRH